MSSLETDRFLAGTLVSWLRSCLDSPHSPVSYWDLTEARCLQEVFLKIDPQPLHHLSECDYEPRPNNLLLVYENIRQFYEIELNSVVLKVPDIESLIEDPQGHVEDMKILLILLLGCAVQCSNKDDFIARIMMGSTIYQADIMEHIQQVTEGHELVVSFSDLEELPRETIFEVLRTMSAMKVRSNSRKETTSDFSSINFDRRSPGTPQEMDFSSTSRRSSSIYEPSNEGLVYKLRNELDKLKEAYLENLDELEETKNELDKVRDENRKLSQEAKLGRGYRDKLDIFVEKSSQVDQLQKKLASFEQKARDNEFLRMRVQELLEDNKQMQDNYDRLYDQLTFHKSKAERIDVLEEELIRSRDFIEQLSVSREQEMCVDEKELSFKKFQERLDETGISEPDLIAGVGNVSGPNLFEEMTYNLENENRNLVARVAVLEKGRSVTSCVLHSKKIKQLQMRGKKLNRKLEEFKRISTQAVLETQKLVEQMTEWQCRAVLFETRWIVQRCKKATILDKDSLGISKARVKDGKFDQEGNFVGFCKCEEVEKRERNFVAYVDQIFYCAVALGTAVIFKKIFD